MDQPKTPDTPGAALSPLLPAPPIYPGESKPLKGNAPLPVGKGDAAAQGEVVEACASGGDCDNAVCSLSFSQPQGTAPKAPTMASKSNDSGGSTGIIDVGSTRDDLPPDVGASLTVEGSQNGDCGGGSAAGIDVLTGTQSNDSAFPRPTASANDLIDRHRDSRAMQSASTIENRGANPAPSNPKAAATSTEAVNSRVNGGTGPTSPSIYLSPPPSRRSALESPRSLDFRDSFARPRAGGKSSLFARDQGDARGEGDVGGISASTGIEDYTWFPSSRRGGKIVYDKVRVNDFAQEIKALKKDIARGNVTKADGERRLKQFEKKIFTLSIGDALEIHSAHEFEPYVAKLQSLDKSSKRCQVKWYYTRPEVEAKKPRNWDEAKVGEREILGAHLKWEWLDLATVKRKVRVVSQMPPSGRLPDDTYLCFRQYQSSKKLIVPLKQRLPRRADGPSSPSLMSQVLEDTEEEDTQLLSRWNRVGPEFDVEVPAWSGPDAKKFPPAQEHIEKVAELEKQRVWSASALPSQLDAVSLRAYLEMAETLSPVLPGTLVYLRPRADETWEDGVEGDSSSGYIGGLGPMRWGLVSELPAEEASQRLGAVKDENAVPETAKPPECTIDGSRESATTDEQIESSGEKKVEADAGADPSVFQQQLPWGPGDVQELQLGPSQSHQMAAVAAAARTVAQEEARQGLQLPEAQRAGIWAFNRHQSLVLPQQEERQQQWLRQEGTDGCKGALEAVARIEAASRVASVAAAAATAAATAAVFASGSRMASGTVRSNSVEIMTEGNREAVTRRNDGKTPAGQEERWGTGAGSPRVWIVNPSEDETPPFSVERWRIFGRQFEEEALMALMHAKGDTAAALERLSSKKFLEELTEKLREAGEIWTKEEVAGVVKACERISARRASREENFKDIGDDLNDEDKYGMEGVRFRRIVDFERRFGRLKRDNSTLSPASRLRFPPLTSSFGQRRGFSADPLRQKRRRARAPGSGHASSLPSRAKSGGREKIEITRTALKQSRVTSRSSSRRGRIHVIKQEAEEVEDDDIEYDGCSSDVDVGNELEVLEQEGERRNGGRGVTPPNAAGKIPETVDLAMSTDDDEDFFMEPAGSSDEELIQEQQEVEEEKTSKRIKMKEGGQLNGEAARGNSTASAGAVASARPTSSDQRERRSEVSGSVGRADGNPGPLPQDESPLPGVASGNTGGGEAWTRRGGSEGVNGDNSRASITDDDLTVVPSAYEGGSRQAFHEQGDDTDTASGGDEGGRTGGAASAQTADDMTNFMESVQDALDLEIFQSFVDGLKAHRENRLGLSELVEHCRECLRPLKDSHWELILRFNSYLPPGNAVRYL